MDGVDLSFINKHWEVLGSRELYKQEKQEEHHI